MRGQQREIARQRTQHAETMDQRRVEITVLRLIPGVVDEIMREKRGRLNAFRVAAQRATQ